jgi:hypothetical protein
MTSDEGENTILPGSHYSMRASKSYIDTYGMQSPSRKLMAPPHRADVADQGKAHDSYKEQYPGRSQTVFVAMRTDVSTMLYAATELDCSSPFRSTAWLR